jgi:hypothetical protein
MRRLAGLRRLRGGGGIGREGGSSVTIRRSLEIPIFVTSFHDVSCMR